MHRQKYLRIPEYIEHSLYITLETRHLDETLSSLHSLSLAIRSFENRIEEYLSLLRHKLSMAQHQTHKATARIAQQIRQEKKQHQVMCSLSPRSMICLNQTKYTNSQLTLSRDPALINQVVQKYVLYQIGVLQEKQFLESIYFVRKFHKIKNGTPLSLSLDSFFKIQLEPNFYQKDLLISEEKILQLDKHRENSLFNAYNVSQKSYFTHISQNVYQFNEILRKRKSNKPP